jgi:cleavage stimulation factor subunit 2
MAATTCRCSSVVFVGNIPYHASEDELRSACEEVGPVASLRVATDGGTGRPRGFAFCEYLDDEAALSAGRNLDGRPLRGRALRVRLADRGPSAAGEDQPVGVSDATHAATVVPPPARPSAAVTAYLAGMSRRQLREMLEAVGAQDEEVARREYAGFATLVDQARLLLDMADAEGKKGARKRPAGGSPDPAAAGSGRKRRR